MVGCSAVRRVVTVREERGAGRVIIRRGIGKADGFGGAGRGFALGSGEGGRRGRVVGVGWSAGRRGGCELRREVGELSAQARKLRSYGTARSLLALQVRRRREAKREGKERRDALIRGICDLRLERLDTGA